MITPSKLRTRFFLFCFIGWTGLACLLGLWSVFLPRKKLMKIILVWASQLAWLERKIVGLDYIVKGRENIPDGPCIIAAKHQSIWETCKMFHILGDPAIVLKEELTRMPVLKWYAKASGMIPIDRKGRVKSLSLMMTAALQAVADNRKIVIFPQGTRVNPFEKKSYKTGVAGIYQELNIPVVPMALNSGVFWPRSNDLIKSGTITVEFLPPIPPGMARHDMMKQLEKQLEEASDILAQPTQSIS